MKHGRLDTARGKERAGLVANLSLRSFFHFRDYSVHNVYYIIKKKCFHFCMWRGFNIKISYFLQ